MDLKQLKIQLNNNAESIFNELGMNIEIFGDNIYSKCPVHEHSDNPRAFSFSKTKGIWKCWTRDCQHEFKNDIFGLIIGALSLKENKDVDFKYALKWVCDLLNIKNEGSSSKKEIKEENTNDDFYNIIDIFSKTNDIFIPSKIKSSYKIEYPSRYFLSRGFKKETLEFFNIGDCVENSGILRDRAIVPIYSDDGKEIVGFIGRSVKEYKIPKFLIYPKGFDKRHFFYNYHNAIDKAIEKSCLFILEGQGDVWKLHEHGVVNAVSIFGKTISKEQEDKLLSLPITHLIILTDNDQAGRESKVQIKRQLGRTFRLTFPKMSSKDVGDMSNDDIEKMLTQLKGTY
jgi:DNA primase